jgi:hypothetical protein
MLHRILLIFTAIAVCFAAVGAPRAAAPSDFAANVKTDTAAKHARKRILMLAAADTSYKTDTSKAPRQFAFTISAASNDVRIQQLDTSLRQFYIDNPIFLQDAAAVYLGTLGSASMPMDYFKRTMNHEFLFAQPYAAYLFTPENVVHLNTTTPYALLFYDWTRDRRTEDMQIRAMFAANITNKLSFGVRYNNIGSKGIYQRQDTRVFSVNVFTSFFGEYYSASGGFLYNHARMQENGGLVDDAIIFNPNFDRPDGAEVRLAQARNQLWNSTWYLSHSVDLPLYYIGTDSVIFNIIKLRLGHTFQWARYSRLYTDNEVKGGDSAYYSNFYMNTNLTRDSLAFRRMENRLFMQLRPLRAYIFEQVHAGIGWRNYEQYMFMPSMYLTGLQSGGMSSVFAYAGASAWYKRYFQWNAHAQTTLSGYGQGNLLADADLRISLYPVRDGLHIAVRAELNSMQPSFFYQQYYSNHYAWGGSADMAGASERVTQTNITAHISIPQTRTQAEFKYGLHANYIYFDEAKQMRQHGRVINVMALTISQDVKLWYFMLKHRILLQKSDEASVLDLPLFTGNATYYFDYWLVKKVLRLELGVDVQYSTQYRGYGYDPSLGSIHVGGSDLGGYLWADLFVSARWYRAVPFVRWEHVNQNLWEQPIGFWAAEHYPRGFRVFKFGLAWRFFD